MPSPILHPGRARYHPTRFCSLNRSNAPSATPVGTLPQGAFDLEPARQRAKMESAGARANTLGNDASARARKIFSEFWLKSRDQIFKSRESLKTLRVKNLPGLSETTRLIAKP
jgi:hypothetical protein